MWRQQGWGTCCWPYGCVSNLRKSECSFETGPESSGQPFPKLWLHDWEVHQSQRTLPFERHGGCKEECTEKNLPMGDYLTFARWVQWNYISEFNLPWIFFMFVWQSHWENIAIVPPSQYLQTPVQVFYASAILPSKSAKSLITAARFNTAIRCWKEPLFCSQKSYSMIEQEWEYANTSGCTFLKKHLRNASPTFIRQAFYCRPKKHIFYLTISTKQNWPSTNALPNKRCPQLTCRKPPSHRTFRFLQMHIKKVLTIPTLKSWIFPKMSGLEFPCMYQNR